MVLSLFAVSAHAETWLQVAELDKKGSVLLLETTGIDRTTDLRKASFKSVYTVDRPIPGGFHDVPAGVETYRWELHQGQFDCKERTLAVSLSTLHGADDKVVSTREIAQADLKFSDVPPQSVGGLMLKAVCSNPTPDGQPEPPLARIKRYANPVDHYPSTSIRSGEEGATTVKACVGPSGALLRPPEIVNSSGFPNLDGAAVRAAKDTRYAPAIENGAPAPESCVEYKITFELR
jgi:TonB family protein